MSQSTAAPALIPFRHPSWRFLRVVASKVVVGVLTVWLASVVVFAAVEVLPQDPARVALGIESSEAQRAQFREEHGLNDGAAERYLRWASGIVRGDFGTSIVSGRPIADELAPRLYYTAILALAAVALSVVIGLPLAMIAARRPGGAFDTGVNMLTVSLSAVPEFVIGILLAWLFASQLGLLPLVSTSIQDGNFAALVLPTLTLGLMAVSYVYRFSRVGVIEAGQAPFIRAATLRGVSSRRVTTHHVLPVAGGAVVNVVALNAIYLLGGVVVVENVFSYPGLGTLLVTGVQTNDLPVIEAVAVATAALLVAINLAADTLDAAMNPRTRGATR
ncbi:ABC transporter permease [Cryptosporangium sp. NPDC051539]|uniref:ABC transporter permease n=1 Tax=Cryptosporangium sp. NPDC051539 TaxID=3363962 RepID=UPI0037AF109A